MCFLGSYNDARIYDREENEQHEVLCLQVLPHGHCYIRSISLFNPLKSPLHKLYFSLLMQEEMSTEVDGHV